ncbi:MAG: hypothetical protein ACRDVG_07160 [Jatrophihabitantaceae bacterium]
MTEYPPCTLRHDRSRPRNHADDLRTVVDAMPYIAQAGGRWR